jgi:pyruvate dehydrogenase E2 component (dihydrolipoamide acetyltransferase)
MAGVAGEENSMQEVKLPSLGEGVEHGDVVRVTVSAGDYIKVNQTVLELETDKALIEVPCPVIGKVEQVHVKAGDRVLVGAKLISVAEAEQPAAGLSATLPATNLELISPQSAQPTNAAAATPTPALPASQPQLAVFAQPAEVDELLRRHPADLPFDPNEVAPAAGPATRRLARELGVDLRLVPGSGRNGRINQQDIRDYIKGQLSGVEQASQRGCPVCAPELPDFTQWGEVAREPLSKVRQTIARHLGQSWVQVPQVTQFARADITELESTRQRLKPAAGPRGVRLTLMPFIIKAAAIVLAEYPRFNSSLDLARNELVLKRYVHFGIATDTSRGLLVPVLRDVDRQSIWQLAMQLEELAGRARGGKVELAELRGATFSISNQGGIGGEHFTPLVNHPEAAILGLGQARWEPQYFDGPQSAPVPRLLLPLALSYDHRICDGADAARWITRLQQLLSDPVRLLLGI